MAITETDVSAVLRRDPAAVKADILRVATAEFVENGFGGARIDEIAARTQSTKRMIYYYFHSKEALFTRVLDYTFDGFWQKESQVDMTGLDPAAALRHFAEERFAAFYENSDFVRLLAIENVRAAEHLATRAARQIQQVQAADPVREILAEGVAAGLFRSDIDAIDVRMLTVSFASFRSVFRATVATIYHRDMLDPASMGFYRRLAGDMLIATLTTFPS